MPEVFTAGGIFLGDLVFDRNNVFNLKETLPFLDQIINDNNNKFKCIMIEKIMSYYLVKIESEAGNEPEQPLESNSIFVLSQNNIILIVKKTADYFVSDSNNLSDSRKRCFLIRFYDLYCYIFNKNDLQKPENIEKCLSDYEKYFPQEEDSNENT